jgi:hypothetical protein
MSRPAFGAPTAIFYITVGALIDVWTAVWYFTFARNDEGNIARNTWFWLAGLFLTGLTLIIVGVLIGEIGRSARKAEIPPPEVKEEEAAIQQTAAAVPHPIMVGGMSTGPMPTAPMMPVQPPGVMPAAPPVVPAAPPPPAQQPVVPNAARR